MPRLILTTNLEKGIDEPRKFRRVNNIVRDISNGLDRELSSDDANWYLRKLVTFHNQTGRLLYEHLAEIDKKYISRREEIEAETGVHAVSFSNEPHCSSGSTLSYQDRMLHNLDTQAEEHERNIKKEIEPLFAIHYFINETLPQNLLDSNVSFNSDECKKLLIDIYMLYVRGVINGYDTAIEILNKIEKGDTVDERNQNLFDKSFHKLMTKEAIKTHLSNIKKHAVFEFPVFTDEQVDFLCTVHEYGDSSNGPKIKSKYVDVYKNTFLLPYKQKYWTKLGDLTNATEAGNKQLNVSIWAAIDECGKKCGKRGIDILNKFCYTLRAPVCLGSMQPIYFNGDYQNA